MCLSLSVHYVAYVAVAVGSDKSIRYLAKHQYPRLLTRVSLLFVEDFLVNCSTHLNPSFMVRSSSLDLSFTIRPRAFIARPFFEKSKTATPPQFWICLTTPRRESLELVIMWARSTCTRHRLAMLSANFADRSSCMPDILPAFEACLLRKGPIFIHKVETYFTNLYSILYYVYY